MAIPFTGFCQQGDIEIIRGLNAKFLNAIVNRDTSALSSVLADDFVLVNPGGKKNNKQDNLANAISPGIRVMSVTVDSVEVRMVSNSVGIVTAWTTFVMRATGKETQGKNCYQDVYEKRNGTWKAISAHVTLLGTR